MGGARPQEGRRRIGLGNRIGFGMGRSRVLVAIVVVVVGDRRRRIGRMGGLFLHREGMGDLGVGGAVRRRLIVAEEVGGEGEGLGRGITMTGIRIGRGVTHLVGVRRRSGGGGVGVIRGVGVTRAHRRGGDLRVRRREEEEEEEEVVVVVVAEDAARAIRAIRVGVEARGGMRVGREEGEGDE